MLNGNYCEQKVSDVDFIMLQDILEFVDIGCNRFLSNICLVVASYTDMFLHRDTHTEWVYSATWNKYTGRLIVVSEMQYVIIIIHKQTYYYIFVKKLGVVNHQE